MLQLLSMSYIKLPKAASLPSSVQPVPPTLELLMIWQRLLNVHRSEISGSTLMAHTDLPVYAHHLFATSLTELSTQIHLSLIHISGSLLHSMPAHLSIATLN